MILFEGKATGVSFQPAKGNIRKLAESGLSWDLIDLTLQHCPDNKYDSNAIRIKTKICGKDLDLGWVPSTINKKILDHGLENISCEFMGFNLYEDVAVGFEITLVKE